MSLLGFIEKSWYLFHRRADVIALLRERLEKRGPLKDVLDLGGGTGRVPVALAPALGGAWTVADIDGEALASVPTREPFRTVVLEPGKPLPFPDASFDAVLLVDVLHHVHDQEPFLREARRCLRRPGVLLIVDFDASQGLTRFLSFLAPRRCLFNKPEDLRIRLEGLGLRVSAAAIDSERYLAEGDSL